MSTWARAATLLGGLLGLGVLVPLARAEEVGQQELVRLTPSGSSSLDRGPTTGIPPETLSRAEIQQDLEELTRIVGPNAPRTTAPLVVPSPPGSPLALVNPGFFGFDGLTHADQRTAGTGIYANSQFSKEPPDMALCVGNGYALQAVNTALAVYRGSTGERVMGPTPLNQFFGLRPEIDRITTTYGDFTSDPRCLYDPETNRWYVVLLQIDQDPATGALGPRSSLRIAVSRSGDPTGSWNLFTLDTTSHGGARCPCFGDQPLIGTDANGLFISTNAFALAGGFQGAQLYAMSKFFLAFGAAPPVVHMSGLTGPGGGFPFSIQPATTAAGALPELAHFGTEYFSSIFDIRQPLENQIVVWALTNTFSLHFPSPHLGLSNQVLASEVYGVPPDATQKPGPTPLGTAVGEGLEMISTNDHRMQQVVYARGHLWSALTTIVQSPAEPDPRSGLAYFVVDVDPRRSGFDANVEHQGYVAVDGAFVMYPAIGVNARGRASMVFTLSGPAFYPSAAYVELDHGGRSGPVHIAAAGALPDDGFSGYFAFGGTGSGRWGDYSAATAAPDGSIWMATEYIPDAPRTLLANWGSFIARVEPGH